MSDETNKAFTDTQKLMLEQTVRQARMEETLKGFQNEMSRMANTLAEVVDTRKVVDDLNSRISNFTSRQQRLENIADSNHANLETLEKELTEAYGALKATKWVAGIAISLLMTVSGYLFNEIVRLHDAELHLRNDVKMLTQNLEMHKEVCEIPTRRSRGIPNVGAE
jgi:chromosome segregation ATPase